MDIKKAPTNESLNKTSSDSNTASPLHKVAEFYAKNNFKVFPCVPNKKTPATSNGFKAATNSLDQVSHWWGSGQINNIGIATGAGVVVIDIDVKNGIDGNQALADLEAELKTTLPETLTASTPSGGKHLYFRYPSEYSIKSSANQLAQGVDIRADGGYVVAAPSKTDIGEYRWLLKGKMAELPHQWISRVKQKHKKSAPSHSARYDDSVSIDSVRDALKAISAHDHDDWVKVGMACHKLGADGFTLWDEWSRTAENYDYSALVKRWNSFEGSAIQPATIFYMAKDAGWVNPKKRPSPSVSNSVPVERTPAPVKEVISQLVDGVPEPLPDELPPVMAFKPEWFPEVMADFVDDAATRMSAPPDYIAVGLLVSMAAVIGRKVAMRPQQHSDWSETCNLWGMIIGRPGVMKSPSLGTGLRPINHLIAKANRLHEEEYKVYEANSLVDQLRYDAIKKEAAAKLKKDSKAAIDPNDLIAPEDTPPNAKRYMTSDALPEAMLEVLRHNPNGIMVYRDEITGLLKGMVREDRAEQRALFLTGWNGNEGYTSDRIGRGLNIHVEAVCLSVLGGTQPGKVSSYVRQAVKGGDGDDGLLQRFAVTVWPDIPEFKQVDEPVNTELNNALIRLFKYLDEFTPEQIEAQQDTNAEGEPDGLPYLRFDDDARGIFEDWRMKLEQRLRSDDLHPAFESHLAKYRKLIPSLALILHLANREVGAVGTVAIMQAIRVSEYLESHANRLYASVQTPEVAAAKLLLKKIKSGALSETFKLRDVYRKGWPGLDNEGAGDAVAMLLEYGWLLEETINTGAGRPTKVYVLSPLAENA